ncbi:hypothetical protein AVEN_178726-1 [Araneus ventricosus]|uniref:Uncharacterized protein n=1 Tax=Araneus ventricosus TaxID=182803 RepID=A0A4Y2T2I3_ARAVE|nr:hypothetical protein AVEN_178726-1 [Araneus ventricosus]
MFLQIGNEALRRSKSATVGESQRNYQNGCSGEEGTSGTSMVPRKQIITNCSKMLSPRVLKWHSLIKNSFIRWYEQFKRTGNVHHWKGAGSCCMREGDFRFLIVRANAERSSYFETDNKDTLCCSHSLCTCNVRVNMTRRLNN